MHFLLVDTADSRGCASLFQDSHVLRVELHPAEDDYSSWLLPAVQRILSQSQLTLADLNGYAVCSGPGSFTGLRIGLTTVKAWAEIYGKPIAAVSRLDALAVTTPQGEPALHVASYFDARREQVFAALFDASKTGYTAVEPETVIGLRDFVEKVEAHAGALPVLWRTPDPHLLQPLPEWASRQAKGDTVDAIAPPFAAQLGIAAYRKFLQGELTDALSLDANYVRRSDAEIFWKGSASAGKA